MDEIILIKPTLDYEEDITNFRNELREQDDRDSFAGCSMLEYKSTVAEWIEFLDSLEHEETCPEGFVTSNCYLAVRLSDNKIVGIIDFRHNLNSPILSLWGGHIGYTVRPSERKKGYATEMLRLNLINCKNYDLDKVMITCHVNNIASEKTIINNGGVYEYSVLVDGDEIETKRYWIDLTEDKNG